MRIPRVFIDASLSPDSELLLPEQAHRHLAQVLRLSAGHPLTVFNGKGGEFSASITLTSKRQTTIYIEKYSAVERESPLSIILAQCVSKGPRMDFVMQKATELGVASLIPVISKHGAVKLDAQRVEKKRLHWQGVCQSACEQSGRNRLPELIAPCHFDRLLEELPQADLYLYLDPEAGSNIADISLTPKTVFILIGPEGGLADTELGQLPGKGFTGLRFGPRILRTETAALGALTACQMAWGDLA